VRGGKSHVGRERAGGIAAAMTLALLVSACGSSGNLLGGSSLDLFGSSKAKVEGGSEANASATDIECPSVEVRVGASTLMIGNSPTGGEPSALDLKYQGTIIRTARECAVANNMVTMKVGIEGRIITGPAGGPGQVDVPMRLAVVQEGVQPRPIVSKFMRETVTVNSSVDRVTFTHVEPDITFPMPARAADIDSYVVYIGFDPSGAQPQPKTPAKPKAKRPAAKPKQS
jgi:hypothetical protein